MKLKWLVVVAALWMPVVAVAQPAQTRVEVEAQ